MNEPVTGGQEGGFPQSFKELVRDLFFHLLQKQANLRTALTKCAYAFFRSAVPILGFSRCLQTDLPCVLSSFN